MVMDSGPLVKKLLTVGALLMVSACGGLSFPSSTEGPRSINRPSGSDVFINATAVKVGRGDTVYSIARRHKLSPRAIIDANNLRPPYALKVGQRLELPQGRVHTVRSGEYLSLIAKRYSTDAYSIARINAIAKPYTIYPGQKLRIPRAGGGDTVVASTPPQSAPRTAPRSAPTTKVTPTRPTSTAPAKAKVPEPPKRSSGKFGWPLQGKVLSNYGTKDKGLHNDGMNIAAPRGTAVQASENGVVAYAGNEIRGFGNLLLVKHDGGWVTAYAHNDTLLVKRGQRVKRGQSIAKVGSTGSVSTPQLHFELRKGSTAVDPRKYM